MTLDEYTQQIKELRIGTPDEKERAIDLFCQAVNLFNIEDTEGFAIECGYPVACNIRRVDDEG
jgi:hypothetical protein